MTASWCNLGLGAVSEQLSLSPVLQCCEQWSVNHSVRAAASSFFCRRFRVMSLFALGAVLNGPYLDPV